MNLVDWLGNLNSATGTIVNLFAIIAGIWAFFGFLGWIKRKQGSSESAADLELQAKQHAERLRELQQQIARAEQIAEQQRQQEFARETEKERQLREEIAKKYSAEIADYEAKIREIQNRPSSSKQNEIERLRNLNDALKARNEVLERQRKESERQREEFERESSKRRAEQQRQQAEEKRLLIELQAELRKEQAKYALLKRGKLFPYNPIDWMRLFYWLLWMPQYFNAYQDLYGKNSLEIKKTASWLISTLVWLPLFMAMLALSMELLPLSADDAWQPKSYAIFSGILAIFWLLTGIFGHLDPNNDVDIIVALAIAVVLLSTDMVGVVVVVGSAVVVVGSAVVVVGSAVDKKDEEIAIIRVAGVAGVAVGVVHVVNDTDTLIGKTIFEGVIAGVVISVVATFLGILGASVGALIEDSIKNNRPSLIARSFFIFLIADNLFLLWYFYLGGWRMFA